MDGENGFVTVNNILACLNSIAPPAEAKTWDNVGLLVGSGLSPISGVITCLDVTEAVVQAAIDKGANLIVSHHPVIFKPISTLGGDSIPYLLAANKIACIAAHTNFDKAAGGTNDRLAERLSLKNVRTDEAGICRIGEISTTKSVNAFLEFVRQRLNVPAGGITFLSGGTDIKTVAVCGGSGGDYIYSSLEQSDLYLTGELGYHDWDGMRRYIKQTGKTVATFGHYHTEIAVGEALRNMIKSSFPQLEVDFCDGGCPYTIL